MIPTADQSAYLQIIRQIIAGRASLAWILPSYIMATCEIESGFRPLVVNATGRQDGLMQVIPGTVREIEQAYGVTLGPQIEPAASLTAGTLYFDRCARKILASRHDTSLYLYEVAQSYNQGYGGFLAGKRNERYGLKMLAKQTKWAFVDDPTGLAVQHTTLG